MTSFAIAGMQMPVSTSAENLSSMGRRLDVLHQAGGEEEVIPLEIDLDRVRRERDVGLRGLGQPLKSFRDRTVDFAVYGQETFDNDFLDSLGPLVLPRRTPVAGQLPRRRAV
jgi:hypothetical protein